MIPKMPGYGVKYFTNRHVHANFQASSSKNRDPAGSLNFIKRISLISLNKLKRYMKIDIFWSYMMFKCCQCKICFNCSQKVSPEKKLGSNQCCMGILSGSKKLYYWAFSRYLDPPKIPMQHSFDPNFFF